MHLVKNSPTWIGWILFSGQDMRLTQAILWTAYELCHAAFKRKGRFPRLKHLNEWLYVFAFGSWNDCLIDRVTLIEWMSDGGCSSRLFLNSCMGSRCQKWPHIPLDSTYFLTKWKVGKYKQTFPAQPHNVIRYTLREIYPSLFRGKINWQAAG